MSTMPFRDGTDCQPRRGLRLRATIAMALHLAGAALAGPALDWRAEITVPTTPRIEVRRGESAPLEATLYYKGAPYAPPEGAAARYYWQTNGMDRLWWSADASITSNRLSVMLTPAMDPGVDEVSAFFRLDSGDVTLYRADCRLMYKHAPGATPNELPLPARVIDFATVEVANAPWVEEESDPTVPAWARAPAPPAEADPVFVSVSNRFLTAELDPSFGAWLEHGFQTDIDPYFSAAVSDAADYTDAVATGKVDRASLTSIPEEDAGRGVTVVDGHGDSHISYVEIGRGAKASVSDEAVHGAPSNAVIRSVSVAIGDGADATDPSNPVKNQSIAIGNQSRSAAVNSIAIGSGVRHADEDDMSGGNAYAAAPQAIALGYSAKAVTNNAVQIGTGVNDEAHTLKFEGVTIVKDGKVNVPGVDTNAVRRMIQDESDRGIMYGSTGATNGYHYLRLSGYNAAQDSDPEFVLAVNADTNSEYAASFPLYPGSPNRRDIYSAQTLDRIIAGLESRIAALENTGDGDDWVLSLMALDDGASFNVGYDSGNLDGGVYWSTNRLDWEKLVDDKTFTVPRAGDSVWFKAGPGGNPRFDLNVCFQNENGQGRFAAYGSIMSLIDGEKPIRHLSPPQGFNGLFQDFNGLVRAPDLPATNVIEDCYANMFAYCNNLVSAPHLPAKELAAGCYAYMFDDCTRLSRVSVGFGTFAWDGDPYNAPTVGWFNNVPGPGVFICPASLAAEIEAGASTERGGDTVPANWTVRPRGGAHSSANLLNTVLPQANVTETHEVVHNYAIDKERFSLP